MSDFAKLIGRFFARDLIYLIGGLFVALSILFAVQYISTVDELANKASTLPTVLLLPLGGAAYVVGFLTNYLFVACALTAPSDRLVPWSNKNRMRGKIAKGLFYLLNRFRLETLLERLKEEPDFPDLLAVEPADIYLIQAHQTQEYLARTVTVYHFSSCMGSCLTVSGAILCLGYERLPFTHPLWLSFLTLGFGLLLCADSNYRSFQIALALLLNKTWSETEAPANEDSLDT